MSGADHLRAQIPASTDPERLERMAREEEQRMASSPDIKTLRDLLAKAARDADHLSRCESASEVGRLLAGAPDKLGRIVAAIESAPALLDRIEALEAEIERLKKCLETQ